MEHFNLLIGQLLSADDSVSYQGLFNLLEPVREEDSLTKQDLKQLLSELLRLLLVSSFLPFFFLFVARSCCTASAAVRIAILLSISRFIFFSLLCI
jgi:hypothetical protein